MRSTSFSDLMLFTKYLAVSLKSGVTLVESLDMIWDQSRGSMRRMVRKIGERIKAGDAFYEALKKYPSDFSAIYINLVRVGEMSGTLDKSLEQLSVQQRKSHELMQKVRSAMMYPVMILIAVLSLGFSVAIFILPKLLPLFEAFTAELPTSTKVLLYVATLFEQHGIEIGIGFVISIFAIFLFVTLNIFKPITHRIVLRIPIVNTIIKNVNIERFTNTLGTLLKSGIPLDESLKILEETTENRVYKKAMRLFLKEVNKGNRLDTAILKHENLFTKLTGKMVGMGETTGNLDDMLLYLRDFYENEVDTSMKDLSTVLEPVLLIFIGFMVGGVAMAILGPIYKITASIQ